MNTNISQSNINEKSYIKQIDELYNKLLYFDIGIYQNVVYNCLTTYFNVNTAFDIILLKAVSQKSIYSLSVKYNISCYDASSVNEIEGLIETLDSIDENITANERIIKIDELINKEDLTYIGETYKNQLCWLEITKHIISSSINTNNVRKKLSITEWIENLQKDPCSDVYDINNFLSEITKISVAYLFYKEPKQIGKLLSSLPLKFYYLFSKSALESEFLYIKDYNKIVKYKNIPEFSQYNLYPNIVRLGINNIYESIKTCCLQISQVVYNEKENIIKESVAICQQYIKIKTDENPNIIEIPYWEHIVSIVVLIFKMSFIDLSYVSNNSNIQILCELINAIEKFRNYLENNSHIVTSNSDDKQIYINVKYINEIVLFKSSKLLLQILKHKQPDDSNIEVPRFKYNLMGYDDIKKIIDTCKIKIDNIIGINPFIDYCSNNERIYASDFTEFCEKNGIDLHKSDLCNIYNKFVIHGINKNLEYSYIYESIKSKNEKDFLRLLNDAIGSMTHRSVPPSLYVKTIKNLCIIAEEKIDKEDVENSKMAIRLLNDMINKLRIFTLTYKNQLTTPYRFRPLLEYSFYSIDDEFNIKLIRNKELCSPDKDKNIFSFASLGFSPINYTYLENFYYLYNRETHRLNRRMRQLSSDRQKLSIDEKIVESSNKVKEEITKERKSTIQLLGVFGSFIAFVSSIAGMVKSVECFWQFILFSLTFVGCISIFVYLIYFVTKSEDDKKDNTSVIMLYIILLIWIIGNIIYKNHILI